MKDVLRTLNQERSSRFINIANCPSGEVTVCKTVKMGSTPVFASKEKIRVGSSIGRALVSKTKGWRFDAVPIRHLTEGIEPQPKDIDKWPA